ncbi:protoporphyrinogen oxidase [Jatrophihabitans sp.]|uniref:protoporphyrinogen oxidase n=1 Tax=Jatrophihabitans sp. TaxID=1932789 RepID=UPI0030C72BE8|nr:protoporphyrinogen oxidase [Jatrophihabitans sp.]
MAARVAVVGGGISGLSAAWALSGLGHEVTVFEAAAEVGGKLRRESVAGFPIDVGAESILARRPEGLALIDELGLTDAVVHPQTITAGLRVGGRRRAMPAHTMMGIPADLDALRSADVLTDHGLERVAGEPGLPPLPPLTDDVSVGDLVRDRLGNEVADRLVEPLLGGVYAGRADALSLRATMPVLAAELAEGGSLIEAAGRVVARGSRNPATGPVFASLQGGVGRLPVELVGAGRFEVQSGVTVRAVRRTPAGFALEIGAVPDSRLVEFDGVVLAVPAAKAARLLRSLAPAAAAELDAVETASMAIASFAFSGIELPAGSGLLVGMREGLAVKAVTVSSQKWSLETGGLTMLRASVGRIGESQVLQRDDADLIQLVRHDLLELLGVAAEPVDAIVTRWGGGLPQYGVGHIERVARIRAALDAVPGLGICGATFDGIGIPACIATARAAAAVVHGSLQGRAPAAGE